MNTFINERNQKLWTSLSNHYNIKLEKSINAEYSCYVTGKQAIIYVDYKNASADSFTHELLHIYLKQNEFYLGSAIMLTILQSNILSRIMSKPLLEHIGNCLDHIKMFEIYKALGFNEKLFLLDFEIHKCSDLELANLKSHFRVNKTINPYAIDAYIGKTVAMLCDPNSNNDYSRQISEFKKLDFELYDIIEKLVSETKKFDIESNDFLNSYRDISNNFYSGLTKWIHKNKINMDSIKQVTR